MFNLRNDWIRASNGQERPKFLSKTITVSHQAKVQKRKTLLACRGCSRALFGQDVPLRSRGKTHRNNGLLSSAKGFFFLSAGTNVKAERRKWAINLHNSVPQAACQPICYFIRRPRVSECRAMGFCKHELISLRGAAQVELHPHRRHLWPPALWTCSRRPFRSLST